MDSGFGPRLIRKRLWPKGVYYRPREFCQKLGDKGAFLWLMWRSGWPFSRGVILHEHDFEYFRSGFLVHSKHWWFTVWRTEDIEAEDWLHVVPRRQSDFAWDICSICHRNRLDKRVLREEAIDLTTNPKHHKSRGVVLCPTGPKRLLPLSGCCCHIAVPRSCPFWLEQLVSADGEQKIEKR